MVQIPSLGFGYNYNATTDMDLLPHAGWLPPIRYQSHGITFPTWISLFTLCFAPLIVHIIGGAPGPSFLTETRELRWHDRLVTYNPTSILWRYFAILDRRVRARSWSTMDMAASNALFWTDEGWDGEEHMVWRSKPYCGRLPRRHYVPLASKASILTVLTALQGGQAAYVLALSTKHLGQVMPNTLFIAISVGTIFLPVSVFGLLRLMSAIWLTDDYTYDVLIFKTISQIGAAGSGVDSHRTTRDGGSDWPLLAGSMGPDLPQQPTVARSNDKEDSTRDSTFIYLGTWSTARTSSTTLASSASTTPLAQQTNAFQPPSYWASRLLRVLFMVPLGLFLYINSRMMYHPNNGQSIHFTPTSFMEGLSYWIFFVVSILMYSYYFLRERCTSTTIPCINSLWYKIYTGLMFALFATMFVLACIETRPSPCGRFTVSWDQEPWTSLLCPGSISINPSSTDFPAPFGIAAPVLEQGPNGSTLVSGVFAVVNFTGSCFGKATHDVWNDLTVPKS